MNQEAKLINKIIKILPKLTKSELMMFSEVLQVDELKEQLIQVLKSLAELQNRGEQLNRKLISSKSDKPKKEAVISTSSNNLKGELYRVMSNKEYFPNNRDLAEAIRSNFAFDGFEEGSLKESRARLFAKFWRELESLPDNETQLTLIKFLEKYSISKDDDYENLFKILTNRE